MGWGVQFILLMTKSIRGLQKPRKLPRTTAPKLPRAGGCELRL